MNITITNDRRNEPEPVEGPRTRLATKSIYEVEGSFDWLRSKLNRELSSQKPIPTEAAYPYIWLKDIFADTIIVEDEDSGKLYQLEWDVDPTDLVVSFGDPKEVRAAYVAKARNDAKFDDLTLSTPIITRNRAKQIVYGAVLVPGEPDFYGDIVSEEKVEDVAHEFMEKYRYHDLQHKFGDPVATTYESWVTDAPRSVEFLNGEEGMLPKGTWMMAVKVADEYWPDVESGKIQGFSIAGVAKSQLEMALKSKDPTAGMDVFQVPSVNDLEDDDWSAVAVSLVDRPAVSKALFFALKSMPLETKPQKRGILASIFGPKQVDVANKATEPAQGHDEEVAASNPIEEGDPIMAGETNVSVQDIAQAVAIAVKDANKEMLKDAGVIKPEPTLEEKIALAVAEAMKGLTPAAPAQPQAQAPAQAPAADTSADEDDEDEDEDDEESEDRVERLEAAVKSLTKAVKTSLKRSGGSQGLDEDDDDDYDEGDEDGRDLFGRRTRPLEVR